MKLPQPIEYQQAVQRPDITFIDKVLQTGKPRLTPLGSPWAATGGFALTFDITAAQERFAVRCFHRQGNRLQERYARIAEFVGDNPDLDFLVDVTYLKQGIRIEGNPLPIVRMPWVRGTPLNAWVEHNLHDRAALRHVRGQVSQAVQFLRRRSAAHGDLQHGNILVGDQNAIRLVDYDGMFLPSLRNFGAPENGHRNYQHPDRDNHYDESLDLFAGHVIDLSLAALEHEPALWAEFNTDQNLLFSADDFADPGRSALFTRLQNLPELAEPTRRLMSACEADFGAVPNVLLGNDRGGHAKRSPAAGRRGTNHPLQLFARNRSALAEREGDEVTIIGPIVASHTATMRDKTPVTFLNFGNYRRADPALVAFGDASRELRAHFGEDLAELQNRWVSLTGFVQLYKSRWAAYPTPQIEVQRARSLHLLTAAEVEQVVAKHEGRGSTDSQEVDTGDKSSHTTGSGTQQSPKEPPAATTSTATTNAAATNVGAGSGHAHSKAGRSPSRGTESLDQQISNLYSSSRFTQRRPGPETTGPSRSGPEQSHSQEARKPGSSSQAPRTGGSPSSRSNSASPRESGSPPSARRTAAPKSGTGAAARAPRSSPSSASTTPSRAVPSSVVGSSQQQSRRKSWREVLLKWFRRK